jgi:hypothetical protein
MIEYNYLVIDFAYKNNYSLWKDNKVFRVNQHQMVKTYIGSMVVLYHRHLIMRLIFMVLNLSSLKNIDIYKEIQNSNWKYV